MTQAKKLILLLSLAALAGCATPATEHYYRLAYTGSAADQAPSEATSAAIKYELIVDSVRIPDAINRPQLVMQKSATESSISDDQRWVAPLDELITQAVVANLRSPLPDAWLATGVSAGAAAGPGLPRYHLKIQVEQLLIQGGETVALAATWTLQDGSRKMLRRERTVINVPIHGPGYEPVAPAVSEAVQQLSAVIAKGMQAVRPL
ncbi:PqiC family protein [Undibacterium sp.]|uniref:PqiC family protein n=1 Tax=Undibacterium sp. TaxID=1914977 RepID=UPI002C6FEF13|nr:PqiC family protein [Undibacterium sp.]HTD02695.1 PqiC family protein [Undibacterium sp.]